MTRADDAWIAAGRTVLLWLAIWPRPLILLAEALGPAHVFVQEGVFFSKAALVVFGGAYSVLSYVAQQAVETHQRLTPGQMLDGLGMAESTPGPLILGRAIRRVHGSVRPAGEPRPLTSASSAP